jgi:hypothetical protein
MFNFFSKKHKVPGDMESAKKMGKEVCGKLIDILKEYPLSVALPVVDLLPLAFLCCIKDETLDLMRKGALRDSYMHPIEMLCFTPCLLMRHKEKFDSVKFEEFIEFIDQERLKRVEEINR